MFNGQGTPISAATVNFKRVEGIRGARAVLPGRGSADAAGLDLSSAELLVIPPGATALVRTGLAVDLAPLDADARAWSGGRLSVYARVAPRSGLALRRCIAVNAGVVDADYRGELGIVLHNGGVTPFEVRPGDRVAQLVLEAFFRAAPVEVREISETERAEAGYGSTGTNGAAGGPVDAA